MLSGIQLERGQATLSNLQISAGEVLMLWLDIRYPTNSTCTLNFISGYC
jgi:hypothetical protein